jgi:peptidoglycan L-alanyl-D-glutamate endopeptidase CwlK
MDARSEAVLATVDPKLADKVRAAAALLAANGTFLLVVSGLRSAAEQNTLYAQGRTTPGHVVTKAKAGQSMHNYGLAVDVVPYLSGQSGALNWKPEKEQFKAMVAAMKAQGLVWGGDWVTFPDDDHFQMPNIPASPDAAMIADYGTGNKSALEAIWTKADSGEYSA